MYYTIGHNISVTLYRLNSKLDATKNKEKELGKLDMPSIIV